MRLRTIAAVAPIVFGACSGDYALITKPDDPVENYPIVRVEPASIDFGEQTTLDVRTETVSVFNDGVSVLTVDQFDLLADLSYEIAYVDALPIDVMPGEFTQFDVTFQPIAGGSLSGQVVIYSNAANEPEFPVPLYGLGAVPSLEITPNPMRFGSRLIPCSNDQVFTLTNTGTEPLNISSMSLAGEDDMLSFPVAPPGTLTLYEGQSWQVPVRFSPTFELAFNAEFIVQSNDLAPEQHVPITGTSQYAARSTDGFDVPDEQPLDILFAVDQSCSMDVHAANLATQFTSFVNVLDNADVDWKIGVVTADSGVLNQGVLTPTTPSWQSKFTTAVATGSQTTGYSLTEALLDLAWRGMQANPGFHTPGAPLHVILVSDEADQSSGNWATYLTNYQNYAGSNVLRVHGVVDLNPNGGVQCGGTPGGPGQYLNAVQATGGYLLDVCEAGWPAQFATVAQSAVNDLRVYDLSSRVPVDPMSIEVTIDGVPQPTGWTYDPNDIAVVFDPLPPRGSHIDISYGVTPVCP